MSTTNLFRFLRISTPGGGDATVAPVYSRAIALAGQNALFVSLNIMELQDGDGVSVVVQGSGDMQNWSDLGTVLTGVAAGVTQSQFMEVSTRYVRCGVVETSLDPAQATIALNVHVQQI